MSCRILKKTIIYFDWVTTWDAFPLIGLPFALATMETDPDRALPSPRKMVYVTTPEPLTPDPDVILIHGTLDCACQEQEPDAFTSIIPSPPSARNLAVFLATEILQDGARLSSLDATPPASESIRPMPMPIPIGIPVGA